MYLLLVGIFPYGKILIGDVELPVSLILDGRFTRSYMCLWSAPSHSRLSKSIGQMSEQVLVFPMVGYCQRWCCCKQALLLPNVLEFENILCRQLEVEKFLQLACLEDLLLNQPLSLGFIRIRHLSHCTQPLQAEDTANSTSGKLIHSFAAVSHDTLQFVCKMSEEHLSGYVLNLVKWYETL